MLGLGLGVKPGYYHYSTIVDLLQEYGPAWPPTTKPKPNPNPIPNPNPNPTVHLLQGYGPAWPPTEREASAMHLHTGSRVRVRV